MEGGHFGILTSLNDTRRGIDLGAIILTEEEMQAALNLLGMFPQHSWKSLQAVVYLLSHQFCSSPGFMVEACVNFLLGEDGDSLTGFLFPGTWDETPETERDDDLSNKASSENTSSREATGPSTKTEPLSATLQESPEVVGESAARPSSTLLSSAADSLSSGSSSGCSLNQLSLKPHQTSSCLSGVPATSVPSDTGEGISVKQGTVVGRDISANCDDSTRYDSSVSLFDEEGASEQPSVSETKTPLDGANEGLSDVAETSLSVSTQEDVWMPNSTSWRSDKTQTPPGNHTPIELDDSSLDSLPDVKFVEDTPDQPPTQIERKAQCDFETTPSISGNSLPTGKSDNASAENHDKVKPTSSNDMNSVSRKMPIPEKSESGKPQEQNSVFPQRKMGPPGLPLLGSIGSSMPSVSNSSSKSLEKGSHKAKCSQLSVGLDSSAEDGSVWNSDDLPVLSPPKRKRQPVVLVKNDGASLLSSPSSVGGNTNNVRYLGTKVPTNTLHDTASAGSSNVKYLGKTLPACGLASTSSWEGQSTNNSNVKHLGKSIPTCSSTKPVSCELQCAGASSVKYLGKTSPPSCEAKSVSSEYLSYRPDGVSCVNKTSPSKSSVNLTHDTGNKSQNCLRENFDDDYSGKTLSSDFPSTSSNFINPLFGTDLQTTPFCQKDEPVGDNETFSDQKLVNSSTMHHPQRLSSLSTLHDGDDDAWSTFVRLLSSSPSAKKQATRREGEQSTSKPSTTTSGPPIPDNRSVLQKRVDALNARVLGLIGNADSLLHAVKPQAALLPSTSNEAVQSEKQQSAFPLSHTEETVFPTTSIAAATFDTPVDLSHSAPVFGGKPVQLQSAATTTTARKTSPDKEKRSLDTQKAADSGVRTYGNLVVIKPAAFENTALDMRKEKQCAAQEAEQPQPGPSSASSPPKQQPCRPILKKAKFIPQQPKPAPQKKNPILQPAKLHNKQQSEPALPEAKTMGDVLAVQEQQQHGDMPLEQQVHLQRQCAREAPRPGPHWPLQQPPRPDPEPPIILDDSQEEPMIIENPLIVDGPVYHPPEVLAMATPGPSTASHPGLDFGVNNVLEVFPGADRAHVKGMLSGYLGEGRTLDDALNRTLDRLLQEPAAHAPAPVPPDDQEVTVVHVEAGASAASSRDYYKDYSGYPPYPRETASDRLSMDFRNVRMDTINKVLGGFNGHYAPSYRCLKDALDAAMIAGQEECSQSSTTKPRPSTSFISITVNLPASEGKKGISASLMKGPRGFCKRKLHEEDKQLGAELAFINQRSREDKEEIDRKIAWSLLESEYEEQGQSIECGCCFAEHPFENLVQCFEGHLFCCQCLLGYASEAIFGSGKLNLTCMTGDCGSTFPKSQLVKALPEDILKKYDERMAEENLNKAAMEDLVRCPKCNMAVVLDAHVLHFQCPNSACRKEMCRKCKEDWSEHKGKTCEQLEKKDETKLRTSYEEKMTAARIRTCASCQAQFFKSEGCNKMTCRCGATMCYVCRQPQINYKHFCQHPRDPGKDCAKCQNCFLWSNPDEDEKRAIAEMQKEAQEKRKLQGYTDDKLIGAPDEPAVKKRR